jgi:predicted acylesterase/phospholipase RssA
VVKGLLDHGHLPRVIAGSSVGAIVAAYVTTRTPAELTAAFSEDNFGNTAAQVHSTYISRTQHLIPVPPHDLFRFAMWPPTSCGVSATPPNIYEVLAEVWTRGMHTACFLQRTDSDGRIGRG